MSVEYSEMLTAIIFGTLVAIFITAFVILVVICKRQRKLYNSIESQVPEYCRPEVMLICSDSAENATEADELQLNSNLESILTDEQWIDDATGLIPHCLAILKTCKFLTERLLHFSMGSSMGSALTKIIEGAKQISCKVDDMVRSMYPPLDVRLLEARAAALSLAVYNLTLIAKYECTTDNGQKTVKDFQWIDESLAEMETHMLMLRKAALSQETCPKAQNAPNVGSSTTSAAVLINT